MLSIGPGQAWQNSKGMAAILSGNIRPVFLVPYKEQKKIPDAPKKISVAYRAVAAASS